MASLAFDTTFLIDFQRERRHPEKPQWAHEFLDQHRDATLLLPAIALGEFAEGFANPQHRLLQAIIATHVVLATDAVVAAAYGAVVRRLRKQGQLIGSNDLWIAATALAHGVPLVTRDLEHFQRVPGLRLERYGEYSSPIITEG